MKRCDKSVQILILLAMTSGLGGCICTHIPGADPLLVAQLKVGEALREQVILKLGAPSKTFENERILTYKLGYDEKQGYYVIGPDWAPWFDQRNHQKRNTMNNPRFSLVLVFDSNGVLKKQSLVNLL